MLLSTYLDTYTAYKVIIWISAIAALLSAVWLVVNVILHKKSVKYRQDGEHFVSQLQDSVCETEAACDKDALPNAECKSTEYDKSISDNESTSDKN